MKPVLSGRRTNLLRPPLSSDALAVLAILDQLDARSGGSIPLKPIWLNWAKHQGLGGGDLIAAFEELAEAGRIDPIKEGAEVVTIR